MSDGPPLEFPLVPPWVSHGCFVIPSWVAANAHTAHHLMFRYSNIRSTLLSCDAHVQPLWISWACIKRALRWHPCFLCTCSGFHVEPLCATHGVHALPSPECAFSSSAFDRFERLVETSSCLRQADGFPCALVPMGSGDSTHVPSLCAP